MSSNSNIEWTDNTWSPITGCTRVSAGCDNCYSARMTHRLEKIGQEKYTGLTVLNPAGDRHFNGVVKCHEDELLTPFKWKKPRRIFVNSMSDTFHKSVPDEFIDEIYALAAICPHHIFQILTKRPERARNYYSRDFGEFVSNCRAMFLRGAKTPTAHLGERFSWNDRAKDSDIKWQAFDLPENMALKNVWLGTSCENQDQYDNRIEHLKHAPASIRFLSLEPLLGPIELRNSDRVDIHWVIVGGESGPGARPMHPDWARSLRDQCVAAQIPFFFKQWGVWAPFKDNVDRHYRNGRPGLGDTNREYNAAINRMIRAHGGTKLLDDRPEGWQPYMIEQGMGINGGSEDQEFLLNVGKKRAGRLLDEMEWNEMPATLEAPC